jgi:hypothetical protein
MNTVARNTAARYPVISSEAPTQAEDDTPGCKLAALKAEVMEGGGGTVTVSETRIHDGRKPSFRRLDHGIP